MTHSQGANTTRLEACILSAVNIVTFNVKLTSTDLFKTINMFNILDCWRTHQAMRIILLSISRATIELDPILLEWQLLISMEF
jgi:hypothetical protein